MNGTAEYYVARDPYFGASSAIGNVLHLMMTNVFVAVVPSWGAIICEIVIAVLILCGPQSRGLAFVLGCVLHGAIILTIGLWIFGLVMIAIVGLASMPCTERERGLQSWSGLSLVQRSAQRAEKRTLDGLKDRECAAR